MCLFVRECQFSLDSMKCCVFRLKLLEDCRSANKGDGQFAARLVANPPVCSERKTCDWGWLVGLGSRSAKRSACSIAERLRAASIDKQAKIAARRNAKTSFHAIPLKGFEAFQISGFLVWALGVQHGGHIIVGWSLHNGNGGKFSGTIACRTSVVAESARLDLDVVRRVITRRANDDAHISR